MSLLDGPATIPTLSTIGGPIIGGPSSMLSAWLARRHRVRRELVTQKTAPLEQLHKTNGPGSLTSISLSFPRVLATGTL